MNSEIVRVVASLLLTIFCVWVPGSMAMELNEQAYGMVRTSFEYDKTYPLRSRTTGRFEKNGYRFESFAFESFHDGSVPGFLALPKDSEHPAPVVLLLHGVSSDKESWLQEGFSHGDQVTFGLLEKGYAVLALDAQYHGARQINNDFIDAGEMVFKHQWFQRFSNLVTQTVVDYRRAIDYLQTREDIDTSRLGILGYSMGGHMAFLLAANDPRVKTMVSCVVPYTAGMPIEASTFARSLGHLPMLMMMAEQDRHYTREQAQSLYDQVPGANKAIRFYASGHSLPEKYAAEAVKWIASQL